MSGGSAPISAIALEANKRIDALFDIECDINGLSAELSRHVAVAKAIDYILTRWEAFTRFLNNGRICLSNNAAERALRGLALGRKSWLFAGSERGAERRPYVHAHPHSKAQRR